MNRGLAILLLALLLAGCLPRPQPPILASWVYTDLRAFDEVGSPGTDQDPAAGAPAGPLPGQDLIAAYTRQAGDELQIRLDLLDLAPQAEADVYLAMDTAPGGQLQLPGGFPTEIQWDTLVVLPAAGPIQALAAGGGAQPGMRVRALRDPLADTITLSLSRSALTGSRLGFRFQVFLAPPGGSAPVDASLPIGSNDPPPGKAPVLLIFWNTLPAYTPAQALRRWDGAHAGPLGGRHGLRNLLRVARSHRVPLFLLDLKTPASLSALDYLGGIQLVREMAASGLLILPDAAPVFPPGLPAWAALEAAAESRRRARALGLPDSPFLFFPLDEAAVAGPLPPQYSLVFTPADPLPGTLPGVTQLSRWQAQRVLPVPGQPGTAPAITRSSADPPLELRRAVTAAARRNAAGISPNLLVLGGDLPQSAWGDPRFARLALDWLAGHPWVQPISAQDLLAQPSAGEYRFDGAVSPVFSRAAETAQELPPGPLFDAAWQAVLALFAPTSPNPPELPALRGQYAGQVVALLAAARWAVHPTPQLDCSQDVDADGQPECLLASSDTFALFERDTGALTYLFACPPPGVRTDPGTHDPAKVGQGCQATVHQLVGPSSQMITGQSDQKRWDLTAGLAADPAVFPGAFGDASGRMEVTAVAERLAFAAPLDGYKKTYSLLPGGLRAEFQTPRPLVLQIPLALDPWTRFMPGWGAAYQGELFTQRWTWSLASGPQIQVAADRPLSASSFLDSRALMGTVEDPNTDFPPGHYLPFPLSLVEVQGQGDFSVEIRLLDTGRP